MAMFTVSAVTFSLMWVFLLVLWSGKFIFYLLVDGTDKLITIIIIIIIIRLQPMLFSLSSTELRAAEAVFSGFPAGGISLQKRYSFNPVFLIQMWKKSYNFSQTCLQSSPHVLET